MKDTLKVVGVFITCVCLLIGFAFGVPAIQLAVMRMYGTEFESVKTDIYRENKSYAEGTIRDLRELQVDYIKATDSQKEPLAGLILHRANELDWDRLPADVRTFLNELKAEQ